MNRASMAKQVSQGPMKKVKKYAQGGMSELSDRELNELGYRVQPHSARGIAKVQLEQRSRRRMPAEDTKQGARELQQLLELKESLDKGENAYLFGNDFIRSGGGMKSQKAAEYKKGGKVTTKPAKPVKMQKGGMVPCKGCKNPAACKKAGQCLAKA
jgi:hypothetical protein